MTTGGDMDTAEEVMFDADEDGWHMVITVAEGGVIELLLPLDVAARMWRAMNSTVVEQIAEGERHGRIG